MKELQRRYLAFAWWQPRNVGWWAWLLVTVLGAAVYGYVMSAYFALFPATLVTGALLSVGLLAFWLWFIRRPQIFTRISRRAAIAAITWGAAAATGAYAVVGNESIITLVAQLASVEVASAWGAAIAAPITEEVAKALGIVAVLLLARSRLRTPMEGAFLGAYVGLGFEVAETFLYGFNLTYLNFGESEVLATLFAFFAREVLLVAITHMLFSALAGAGLAYLWSVQGPRRPWLGVWFLILAWGLHALWNSPLLDVVWLRLLVAALVPVVFFAMIKIARRDELAWFRAVMAPEVARGTVSQEYVDAMAPSLWGRRRHRRAVAAAYGHPAVAYQRYLEGLLGDMADAVSVDDRASADAYRAALIALLGRPAGNATPAP